MQTPLAYSASESTATVADDASKESTGEITIREREGEEEHCAGTGCAESEKGHTR